MFELFITRNKGNIEKINITDFELDNSNESVKLLFDECGGYNIQNGLYKIHHPQSSIHWSILLGNYFTQHRGKIIPFGYDWMGRQFAIDQSRNNIILMFDPSTLEYFELQQNLVEFHNHDLIIEKNDILSETFFNQLLRSLGINKINYKECAGHKRPLFLNGADDVSNFEVLNMEVYWDFQTQIYIQIKDLPPGTKIDNIKWERR